MMKKSMILFGVMILMSCQSTDLQPLIEPKHDEYFKAICYHPVNVGSSQRSWEFIDEDLDLMQEAGISVIRVYMPIQDEKSLDKIANRGMKIITGFGYNQDSANDIVSGTYLDYIEKVRTIQQCICGSWAMSTIITQNGSGVIWPIGTIP